MSNKSKVSPVKQVREEAINREFDPSEDDLPFYKMPLDIDGSKTKKQIVSELKKIEPLFNDFKKQNKNLILMIKSLGLKLDLS